MTYSLLLDMLLWVLALLGKMGLLNMRRDTHRSHASIHIISYLLKLLSSHLDVWVHMLSYRHAVAGHTAIYTLLLCQHLLLSLLIHHLLLPHLRSQSRVLCGHYTQDLSVSYHGLTARFWAGTYSTVPDVVLAVAGGTAGGSSAAWPVHADLDAYRP
jgi:hypothetical protein